MTPGLGGWMTSWWFQGCFIFISDPWGNDPIWRAYVSNGLGWNHQLGEVDDLKGDDQQKKGRRVCAKVVWGVCLRVLLGGQKDNFFFWGGGCGHIAFFIWGGVKKMVRFNRWLQEAHGPKPCWDRPEGHDFPKVFGNLMYLFFVQSTFEPRKHWCQSQFNQVLRHPAKACLHQTSSEFFRKNGQQKMPCGYAKLTRPSFKPSGD